MSEEIKETLDWTLEYLEGIDKTKNTKILTTNEANILLDYITNLQQKVEQLESIRKEAIEWIDKHDYYSGSSDIYYFSDFTPSNDLLNILNKGDNNVKDKK